MVERFESIENHAGKMSARRAYRLKRCTIFTARLGETKEALTRMPEFHSDPSSVRTVQGGLDPTKGDFDWSEIDQSRSVGAETSYVPFFTPHHAWLTCAGLIRSINTSPG